MSVCDVVWTESDPALPHDHHACLFTTNAEHSRHECRCGLNHHEHEICS